MSWECGECGAVEGKNETKVEAICHHCAKPLCEKHRRLITDKIFSSYDGPFGNKAYHCDDCIKIYHP